MKQTNLTLRTLALLACAACAVGMTAGCKTSASDNAAAAASQVASQQGGNDDYLLKLTTCMRGKGIDVADPDSKGNVSIPQTEAATKAAQECEKEIGPAPGSEDLSKPEVQQGLVKTAQCLRKEGYDVPDPEAGKGLQINGEIPQDVMNKCASNLGNK